MLERNAFIALTQWQQKKDRKPLLVRGSRRVGKTTLVRYLGQKHFDWVLNVSFSRRPEFGDCFKEAHVSTILERLQGVSGVRLIPGKTLLVLDEIQHCREAMDALPLIARQRPEQHIVACSTYVGGPLDDKCLAQLERWTEPLFLQPLSFSEFLKAIGQQQLDHYLNSLPLSPLHPSVSVALKKNLRAYLNVGGMPEAVAAYSSGSSPWDLEKCHHNILATIQADFSSMGSNSQRKYLNEVFQAAPRLVGQTCKYSHINGQMQSRDLKRALTQLWRASCLHPVYHTAGKGRILGDKVNSRKFHLLYADTGLMGRALSLRSRLMNTEKFLTLDGGAPARQFVGQQLMASLPSRHRPQIYFWAREARNSNARVDFLAQLEDMVIPIVVREGKRGTLKSLDIFMEEHPKTPFAIRFSEDELSYHERVLSLPLYLAPYWKNLAQRVLKR